MHETEREALHAAVELMCGCKASYEGAQLVHPLSQRPEGSRLVHTFSLDGHETAPLAYAWWEQLHNVVHHRVVLHGGFAKSPESAVSGYLVVEESKPRPL